MLSKPRWTEVGWDATPIVYTDCVNILAKHKHCKENAEVLLVAINL